MSAARVRAVVATVLWSLSAVLTAGCARADAQQAEEAPTAEVDLVAPRSFDGLVIPTTATDLRAPPNTIRLRNSTMSSNWIKLTELPDDGTEVAKGDVVARFEFRGKTLWPRVRETIDRAKADKEKQSLDLQQQLREMQTELERRQLDASIAALDLQKERSVSARAMLLYKQAFDQAEFEAEALSQRIAVHRRRMTSDAAYREAELARANAEADRLTAYESAFVILAPHKGVLRHGRDRHQHRKIAKGDGMPSGYNFSSVALDASVSVEFFVPEQRIREVKIGQKIKVTSPVSDESFLAEVRSIARFPQEMGFLRKNEDLANAREKAFVVRAEFVRFPENLTAGLEVKVGG
jgi:hypothetical protein